METGLFIVHGEGLTENHFNYAYPYLYFSKLGKEMGIESHLVNFSMFEGEPFRGLLDDFDYLACRDVITHTHLKGLGFRPKLSFDCCILKDDIQDYNKHNGTVSAIRGRNKPEKEVLENFKSIKYNCAWQWNSKDSISYETFKEYLMEIKKSMFVLSTSFHGNIFAYMAGVPFICLYNSNKKYEAMKIELLPDGGKEIRLDNYQEWSSDNKREEIRQYFLYKYPSLVKRAMLNVY